MITGKNYIGFELSAKGGKSFKTTDPVANMENPHDYYEANSEEIQLAVQKASLAYKPFKDLPDSERAIFLSKIADNIEELGDTLLEMYQSECGLTMSRARAERARTVGQLRKFADFIQGDNWKNNSIADEQADGEKKKPNLTKTYLALGPVAVFGASNFPLAYSTAGGDTASALAAGCPVVVKSHPMHAGTGELVAGAIVAAAKELQLPDGVFSNLNSSGIEVGVELVNNPGIKAVGFTGSIRGGRALMDLGAQRPEPIPVFAEMGSTNPVYISEKTILQESEKWVIKYADSVTNDAGQFCTKPGLILALDTPALQEFSKKLAADISSRISKVMVSPGIKRSYSLQKEQALLQAGVDNLSPQMTAAGNFSEQTVATIQGELFIGNPKLYEEVFGPYIMIVKCRDMNELIRVINKLQGQLTGTIIAQEEELVNLENLIDALTTKVGRLIFNGVPTGVEVVKSMTHGGPYPASSDSRFTAVGTDAIQRWLRPITYQNFPKDYLSKT